MLQNPLFWLTLAIIISVWVLGYDFIRRLNLLLNDLAELDAHAQMEVDGKNELSEMDFAMLDGGAVMRHERRVKFYRTRYGYMPPVDNRGWPCWMAWKDGEERRQKEREKLFRAAPDRGPDG
jgi:hypothetical protein